MSWLKIVFIILGITAVHWAIEKYLRQKANDFEGNPISPEAIKRRKKNLDAIMTYAQNTYRVYDYDVKRILDVPENTANRYLGYLVVLGKLNKINERGQKVYYQRIIK